MGQVKGRMLWKVLLTVGCIPFATIFGICLILSARDAGLSFVDCLLVCSIFLWPAYIVGIVLIFLSMLVKMKNEC